MTDIELKRTTHLTNSKEATEAVSTALDELSFQPAPLHQQMKAQFWSRYVPNPFESRENISLASVQEVVSDARLRRYWHVPGFKEWFINQDEGKERLEYLWMVGLDTAEQILRDPAVNAGAKTNMLKLLAEVTGRLVRGSNKDEKFSDAAVNSMSKDELEKWLKNRGVQVEAKYKVTPAKEVF